MLGYPSKRIKDSSDLQANFTGRVTITRVNFTSFADVFRHVCHSL